MPDGDSSIAHSTEWSVEGPFSGLDGFQMDHSVKEQKVPLLSVSKEGMAHLFCLFFMMKQKAQHSNITDAICFFALNLYPSVETN